MKVVMKGLVSAMAVALILTTSAHATMLGWYRMGDDDMSPNGDINSTANHWTGAGSYGALTPNSSIPVYSASVPSTEDFTPLHIYDPLSDTTLSNASSMFTPGVGGTERLRPGSVAVPSTFTFEAFIQPVSANETQPATGELLFAVHKTNAAGGWELRRTSNGSLTVTLYHPNTAVPPLSSVTITTSSNLLPNDQWHHVALVYKNLPDEQGNDLFLYVDGIEKAQGNGTATPDGSTSFYLGNATSNNLKRIFIDEARYLDVALEPNQFLQVVPEPNALILASIGVAGLAGYRVRRRNAVRQ